MTDEETLLSLSLLAKEARVAKGRNRAAAAAEMGIGATTLQYFEHGRNLQMPNPATLLAMEAYFGWRRGVMLETWKNRREIPFGDLTMEMLLPEPEPTPAGLIKAAHLTDKELMAELQFRFLMRDSRNGGE